MAAHAARNDGPEGSIVRTSEIQGRCDERFAAVRDVFTEGFRAGRELGATVVVYVDDQPVVDLWGGLADARAGRAWEHDTPCPIFSGTKAVTATAALMLWQSGQYDVHAPVTTWWPEYGRAGKARTTGAHLLSHRAGLPLFQRQLPTAEAEHPDRLAEQLASQEPIWEPGTDHGYHALTYGWLNGEVVRRLTGHTVGEFVARQIAGPANLDLWLGAPEDVIARTAQISALPPPPDGERQPEGEEAISPAEAERIAALGKAFVAPESLISRALSSPAAYREPGARFNHPAVLRMGWPATGLLATGTGLAGFYREIVAGRLLHGPTLSEAIRPHAKGPDRVTIVNMAYGLGFMLPSRPMFIVPPAARAIAFGHTGAGGGFGLADPARGLAVAYLVNGMREHVGDFARGYRLLDAIYKSL
jgi:CubicO group peptidase (beta-lactamase class C family)